MALKFQTAALGALPPPPALLFEDPLVVERTRFSADRRHRFTLFRHWGDPADFAAGILMNPSGADEDADDRTVAQMSKFARAVWGVGAYYQLNGYSIRLTDSRLLPTVPDPNHPENDRWIAEIAAAARLVVVGWGNPVEEMGRGAELRELLLRSCDPRRVFCFGKNKNGAPIHPRYKSFSAPLLPFFD